MMSAIEDGEASQVIVFSFSRFARSTTHLLQALKKFKERDVQFISLTEKIDTNSPMGVALFTILGALSQLERELIADRVKAGLANARAKGKLIGRKKERDSDLIRKLLKAGMTYRAIATIAKCSHGSVYAEKMSMLKDESEAKKQKEMAKAEEEKLIDSFIKTHKIEESVQPPQKSENENVLSLFRPKPPAGNEPPPDPNIS